MNKLIFPILFGCLIMGCGNAENKMKQKSFKNFDFSYGDGLTNFFSIKFTPESKVFVKDHFAQLQLYSDIPSSDENYYSFITRSDRIKLDSFVNEMNFSSLNSSYYQPTTNVQYQLSIEINSKEKLIYVHSNNMPSKLDSLCKWIVNLKKNLKLITIDSTLKFSSLVDFLPPPVNKPNINIIDPKPF